MSAKKKSSNKKGAKPDLSLVSPAPAPLTPEQQQKAISDALKKLAPKGFIVCAVVDSGDLAPYANAANLGDLLLLQKVLDEEIQRVYLNIASGKAK